MDTWLKSILRQRLGPHFATEGQTEILIAIVLFLLILVLAGKKVVVQ